MTRGLVQRASVVVCRPVGTILKLVGTRNFIVLSSYFREKKTNPQFSHFSQFHEILGNIIFDF